ncbi:MAG TPA: LysR family transcriptional regulator [Acidisoma sp.]|uniref:LysR family transcriptional regulator n=1 Tax=Acidisoma sp. TaxID=1872115 RepID=UPI002CF3E3D2|nr:LysR family transcriptional regulator [Acidisoma sp.]HTI00762.1 LysR family transcriptional regulator [Acidisoma sp.]
MIYGKLEYLIALARERNFTRAAESCGVTQPTFSAGIRALEDEMGMPLVLRSSRFIDFTPEGERVLDWARRIVGDIQAMRADVTTLRRGLTGHLRIATIPTALAVVSTLTTHYRARHPAVRFTILSCTSKEVIQGIENLEVEAGVTYLDNEPTGHMRRIPLYDERYRLLTEAEAPLGDRAQVTWAEVAQIPLCLLTPDMQNRRILDSLLSRAGPLVQPTLESNSIVALASHVQTGAWASILPEKTAAMFAFDVSLRSIPIVEPEAVHSVGLLVPNRDLLPPITAALVLVAQQTH